MRTRIPIFILALLSIFGLWLWAAPESTTGRQQVKGLRDELETTRRLFDPAEWLIQPDRSVSSGLLAYHTDHASTREVDVSGSPSLFSESVKGSFAYFNYEDGVWKLWRQSVESPQPKFVTATRQEPHWVAVYPDHGLLMYALASGMGGDRYFWMQDGSAEAHEVTAEAKDVAVSPDGRYVLYSQGTQLLFRQFQQAGVLSEPLVVAEGNLSSPMFDQDGESVLMLERNDSSWRLIELDWRTLERRELFSWLQSSDAEELRCFRSPNDTKLVCESDEGLPATSSTLRLLDLEKKQELAGQIVGVAPRWVAADEIVFHRVIESGNDQKVELWRMDDQGGNLEQLAGVSGWLLGSQRSFVDEGQMP